MNTFQKLRLLYQIRKSYNAALKKAQKGELPMFKGSWKTTTTGIVTALVGIGNCVLPMLDSDPSTVVDVNKLVTLVVTIVAGLGLFSARDNNKSSEDVGGEVAMNKTTIFALALALGMGAAFGGCITVKTPDGTTTTTLDKDTAIAMMSASLTAAQTAYELWVQVESQKADKDSAKFERDKAAREQKIQAMKDLLVQMQKKPVAPPATGATK